MNGNGDGGGELAQYEMLATKMYAPNSSQSDRQQANQALLGFTESASYIPRCQLILDQSKQPYALLLASTSLLKLMTTYWNSFTPEQTVEIRVYLLNYLATGCQQLPPFIITALIQVLTRTTKLGWNKDPSHRDICDEVGKFLQHTPHHCLVGLQILSALVQEMNTAFTGQSYTKHRKVAVSFRDFSLLQVFRLALKMLKKLKTNELPVASAQEHEKLLSETLKVAIQGLNFDYIGTNPDDASEDGGTIQVPSSWRNTLEDENTLTIFFEVFKQSKPPIASQCLEVLVLMSATRQSLFSNKDVRIGYFGRVAHGTVDIIKTRADALSDPDCYHQFCRLLGRLKSNLQLEDLCKIEGHEEWIKLVAEVTIQSFKSWEFSSHSVHYLLGLWGRLTMDVPYMRGDLPGFLNTFIPDIMTAFIDQRVASMTRAVQTNDLDEVFEMHEASLKHVPNIFKFKYAQSQESLNNRFENLLQKYKDALQAASQGVNQSVAMQISVVENQLAACVYIIGSLIGYNRAIGNVRNEMERIDSEICAWFFRLMPALEFRLSQNFQVPPSRHLELAIIYHLEHFRKRYMGVTATRRVILGSKDDLDIYSRLSQILNAPTTEKTVLASVLNKILTNLKMWTNDQRIIEASLQLFKDLSSTCITCKALAEIDTCKALLSNHSVQHFPFLQHPDNHRYVTQFYNIFARLAFKLDSGNSFDEFMMPFEAMFNSISSGNLRSEQACQTAIQACRQLSGVVAATTLKKSYQMLFDWIYPKYLNVLVRLLETWWDNPDVTTPILRFYSELVYSRAQRITFPPSSPNGILLFRETSKILSIYASRILAIYQTKDVHKEKLKGIGLCLQILHRSLSGNYVNFGVFALYGDKALSNALDAVLKLVLSEQLEQYLVYNKVARDFFMFLRVLYSNHLDLLVEAESKVFLALTSSLHEGLHSFDVGQSSNCAQALDHLFCFVYESSRSKRDPGNVARKLKEHMSQAGSMLDELMASLFNRMLFDNIENHWSIARPTLSLIVISKKSLDGYEQKLVDRQPDEAKPVLTQAFAQLMEGIQPNIDSTNREKFSENMTKFRQTVSKFCVSPR